MKSLLLILFLVSVSLGFAAPEVTFTPPPAPAQVSDEVLLSAIAQVETGNNSRRLGRYGERTQLQILPQTWREYSRLPHSASATNPAETDRVARAYLAHIRARLKARKLPQTPYFIAAAWNAGPGWKKLSSGTIAYAERVANLVETYQTKAAETAEPEPVLPTVAPAVAPLLATAIPQNVPVIDLTPVQSPSPVILLAQPKPASGTFAMLGLQ